MADDQLQECLDYYRGTARPALEAHLDGDHDDDLVMEVSTFEAYLPLGDDYERMNAHASRFVTYVGNYTNEKYRTTCPENYESFEACLRDAAAGIERMLTTVAAGDTPDYTGLSLTLDSLRDNLPLRDDVEPSRIPEDSPAGAAIAAYLDATATPTTEGSDAADENNS